jgi:hypothetical protein
MLIDYTSQDIEINGVTYSQRHGGPFDRGAADSYYHRPRRPHFFMGDTYNSQEILPAEDSDEYKAYMAGYDYNEQCGDKKDWG